MDINLHGPPIHLKGGMDFEAIISQLQPLTKKVLCVEDGLYLRVFPECGPFPFGLEFEHKQKRWGMSEYIFRCDAQTQYERVMCVFGRDNAETFCPDFIDDQDTSSEEFSEDISTPEELYSDLYTTSSSSEDHSQQAPTEEAKTSQSGEEVSQNEHEEHIVTPCVRGISLNLPPKNEKLTEKTYVL